MKWKLVSINMSMLIQLVIVLKTWCHPVNEMIGDDKVAEEKFLLYNYFLEFFREASPLFPSDHSLAFFKQRSSWSSCSGSSLMATTVDFREPLQVLGMRELLVSAAERAAEDGFSTDSLQVNVAHVQSMLANPALCSTRNHLRDYRAGGREKHIALSYLLEKLGSFADQEMLVGIQGFRVRSFRAATTSDQELKDVSGNNVLAILPGAHWGSELDEVVIVGAHWDTVEMSEGFDDNTSGVTALIELTRALRDCRAKFSLIIVAFDLEEFGGQGSEVFINGFLMPHVLKKFNYPKVQGVFILDSVMSFNETIGAQRVDRDFLGLLHNNFDDLKGDFIATVARNRDRRVARVFEHHWERSSSRQKSNTQGRKFRSQDEKFRLQSFLLNDTRLDNLDVHFDMAMKYSNFLRSDHARFWFVDSPDYKASFNTILVTDTGPARGVMDKCYHHECDSRHHNASVDAFANLDFFVQVIQTVIDSVVDLVQADCPNSVRDDHMDRFVDVDEKNDHISYEMRMKEKKKKSDN